MRTIPTQLIKRRYTAQRATRAAFNTTSTTRTSSEKTFRIGVIGATTALIALYVSQQSQHNHKLSEDEIKKLINAGRLIVSMKDKAYDVTDFASVHPGGESMIKAASGHDITKAWETPTYRFHQKNDVVKEILHDSFIGRCKPLPDMTKLPSAIQFDERYIQHSNNCAEAITPEWDGNGESKTRFVRDHGAYSINADTLYIKDITGKKKQLNNQQLQSYEQQSSYQLVTCAGGGRSSFDESVDGIPWGLGADALYTIRVQGTSLENLFQSLNMPYDKACLILVTGSDGYSAAIHSSEFKDFILTTQTSDGKPLPELNGRHRRLMGKGVGFRQIKDVTGIQFIPELPDNELSQTLIERLKDPMTSLHQVTRQVLAACPAGDAYVQKDRNGKPYGFNIHVPTSTIIHEIKESHNNPHEREVTGIVYGDSLHPTQATARVKGKKPTPATLFFPKGSDQFAFLYAKINVDSTQEKQTVIINASNGNGQPQPKTVPYSQRGLWGHSKEAKREISLDQSQSKNPIH